MKNSSLTIANQTVYFQSAERMEQLDDESITLVVTSPPYWNVRDYGYEAQIGFQQSYNDYIASLNRVWEECIRVLQPNGKIAINLQPLPISADLSGFNRRIIKNIMTDVEKFMESHDLFLSGMIYWNKSPYINSVSWGSYPKPTNIATNTAFEQIFTFVKRGKTRKIHKDTQNRSLLTKEQWRHWAVRMVWDDISPVIKINQRGQNLFGHSAPFPEDIPYRLIKMHTIEGEQVLDPFLGSGTTLKMCRLTNRRGIGYEMNPKFRDLIETRIHESWVPPYIDSQYKTFASKDIAEILSTNISQTLKTIKKLNTLQKDGEIDENISEMVLQCSKSSIKALEKKGILSKANSKAILSHILEQRDSL